MNRLEKAVAFMVTTAQDDTHGYDQHHRNGPDYDCSSLVCTALFNAGFSISPQSYTGNMYERLKLCGFVEVKTADRKPGDIFLTPGKHTCMAISEKQIAEARINELGKTTGGKTGDQTGKEIMIRNFYNPSYGWKYHMRFVGEEKEAEEFCIDTVAREVIAGKWGDGNERKTRLEDAGIPYEVIQTRVNQLVSGRGKYVDEVAREVIAGKWGNGEERRKKLIACNYNPDLIQERVNEMLKVVSWVE